MIVPADGYVISAYNVTDDDESKAKYKASLKADPFPGANNVTELLSVKLNKSTLKKPFYNIKETNGVISFDYLKDYATGIDQTLADKDTEKNPSIFSLDGRYLGNDASKLTKGIYIIGKRKVVIK